MKQQERKEDAASPVIGVMLMLVVTIVIAAVITVFASGMAGDSTATTPMALLEADNLQVSGNNLKSFDIVHKGGDEMSLENLQVTLEPIGGANSGIILVRLSNPTITVPKEIQDQLAEYGMSLNDVTIQGVSNQLSVKGKSGENVVVSTGDRIKVHVKIDPITISVWGSPMGTIGGSDDENIPIGVTVKWTVSDVRTTGVIAKGEFVVPEP